MKIMVLYNKSSGEDTGKKLATRFQEKILQQQPDFTVILAETGPDIPEKTFVKKAQAEKIETIVMIGGDGTLRHIVKAFHATLTNYTFAILPGGTVNNFATALDIPKDLDRVIEIILAGKTSQVDYALVNQEEVMLSSLTVGILADTAADISQKEKQSLGKWPFIRNFVKMLAQKKKYHLTFETPALTWQENCQLLAITMTNSAGGFKYFDTEATPDDGLMHITILPKMHFFMYLLNLTKILRGKISQVPTIEYFHEAYLKVTSQKPTKIRIDGDDAGELPMTVEVIKHKLTIFTPEKN